MDVIIYDDKIVVNVGADVDLLVHLHRLNSNDDSVSFFTSICITKLIAFLHYFRIAIQIHYQLATMQIYFKIGKTSTNYEIATQ